MVMSRRELALISRIRSASPVVVIEPSTNDTS